MYSARGPVCDIHNEKVIKDLTDGANELAKKYGTPLYLIDEKKIIEAENIINEKIQV